jgi:hypothetical protein
MNSTKNLLVLASITIFASFAAAVVSPHQAFGYGECSAPEKLAYAGPTTHRVQKIRLTWGEYDMSLCEDEVTTKAYEIQVRNSADELILEKTKTRFDKFSKVDPKTKLQVRKLGFNKDLKFRIQAIGNDDSTSGWSEYVDFTTPLKQPRLQLSKFTRDTINHTADVQLNWTELDSENFEYYRVKLIEYWDEAVDSNKYNRHSSEVLSQKITDPATTTVTVNDLHEYWDKSSEKPYDKYSYVATVYASYTIDGEATNTRTSTKQFTINFSDPE